MGPLLLGNDSANFVIVAIDYFIELVEAEPWPKLQKLKITKVNTILMDEHYL